MTRLEELKNRIDTLAAHDQTGVAEILLLMYEELVGENESLKTELAAVSEDLYFFDPL